MIMGFRVTQMLYVAAKLNLADHLAATPQSAEQLATAAGADSGFTPPTHARADEHRDLYRNGRLVRSIRLANCSVATWLVRSTPSPCSMAKSGYGLGVRPNVAQRANGRGGVCASSRNAILRVPRHAFRARDAVPNGDERVLPPRSRRRSRMCTTLPTAGPWWMSEGATGLASPVIDGISIFARCAVRPTSGRRSRRKGFCGCWCDGTCTLGGGDFFSELPAVGDVYLLKSVVHNWPDPDAQRILQCCRRAMAPGARLLLGERIVPPDNKASEAKLFDINMLVVVGGRERTRTGTASSWRCPALPWYGFWTRNRRSAFSRRTGRSRDTSSAHRPSTADCPTNHPGVAVKATDPHPEFIRYQGA